MAKLINKQHEKDQNRRINKLRSDLNQQKSRISKLEKRLNSLEKAKSKK